MPCPEAFPLSFRKAHLDANIIHTINKKRKVRFLQAVEKVLPSKDSEGRIVGKGTVRVPFPLNQQYFNAVKMFAACQKSGPLF